MRPATVPYTSTPSLPTHAVEALYLRRLVFRQDYILNIPLLLPVSYFCLSLQRKLVADNKVLSYKLHSLLSAAVRPVH